MISNNNEFLFYKNNNSKISIYSAFLKCKGIGNSNIFLFNIFKILGYNLHTNAPKFYHLNFYKNNILTFFLTIFKNKQIGNNYYFQKNKMHLTKKHIIGSYRYIRYKSNLPVNGQRTHTNHKTAKILKKQNF
jgi:ribosomal protein S13